MNNLAAVPKRSLGISSNSQAWDCEFLTFDFLWALCFSAVNPIDPCANFVIILANVQLEVFLIS